MYLYNYIVFIYFFEVLYFFHTFKDLLNFVINFFIYDFKRHSNVSELLCLLMRLHEFSFRFTARIYLERIYACVCMCITSLFEISDT